MKRGSLVAVGTGIEFGGHVTQQAIGAIEAADVVVCVPHNVATASWLADLNPNIVPLPHYLPELPRTATYDLWVETALRLVRQGKAVCFVAYGHPTVFADSPGRAVRLAREEGFAAKVTPAVSFLDCLFADLAVGPSNGLQMYEATDFLLRAREWDPTVGLLLAQISATAHRGEPVTYEIENPRGFAALVEKLVAAYDEGHEVVVYVASSYSIAKPSIQRGPLVSLSEMEIGPVSSLFVPPLGLRPIDEELERSLVEGSK